MKFRISIDKPHLGGNIIGGDNNTYYPDLWRWLVNKYNISSVFDIGCGEGHTLREFQKLDCAVFGIDGLKENTDACDGLAVVHDICEKPFILQNHVDLVWCCELVEHIYENHMTNLLDTMAQGTYVAMTHAIPGQPGHHHVNCQFGEYWISKLESINYEYLRGDSLESKIYGHAYWRRTGKIFRRIK